MNEWQDITGRLSKSLVLHLDDLCIHLMCVDNEWFLTFSPFFDQKPMGSIPLDEAKRIALHLVRQKLTAALEGIPHES